MVKFTTAVGLILCSGCLYAQNADNPEEFARNAQLWARIKKDLLADTGDIKFDNNRADNPITLDSLKHGIGGLTMQAVIVEAKPLCAPTKILVYIPMPGQQGAQPAEITLKLDFPLHVTERQESVPARPSLPGFDSVTVLGVGQVVPGSTVKWRNLVAESLIKEPFMLTVPVRMIGLETNVKPCSSGAPPKAPAMGKLP